MVKQEVQKLKHNVKKDDAIKARVSKVVKADLQEIADNYGMSMSGLIAYILGQWVHQQKMVLGPMMQEIGQTAKDTVARQLVDQK